MLFYHTLYIHIILLPFLCISCNSWYYITMLLRHSFVLIYCKVQRYKQGRDAHVNVHMYIFGYGVKIRYVWI